MGDKSEAGFEDYHIVSKEHIGDFFPVHNELKFLAHLPLQIHSVHPSDEYWCLQCLELHVLNDQCLGIQNPNQECLRLYGLN